MVTLFVLIAGVLLFVLLLEKFLPPHSDGLLPVLIAVIAGSSLAPRFDKYLKKRFPKAETMGEVIPPAIVSRLFVVSLIGLHVIAIGLIVLVCKSL